MPPGLSGGSFTFNLEVQAEFHRCRRGLSRRSFTLDLRAAARKEVSLPPDKPGGILEICVPFSRQKVNLRRDKPGGIHKAQYQKTQAKADWFWE